MLSPGKASLYQGVYTLKLSKPQSQVCIIKTPCLQWRKVHVIIITMPRHDTTPHDTTPQGTTRSALDPHVVSPTLTQPGFLEACIACGQPSKLRQPKTSSLGTLSNVDSDPQSEAPAIRS
jgi:hypothetical protein